MTVEVIAKYYGPESSPDEIEAIKNRVYLLRDNIIMWKEIPKQSLFSVATFGIKTRELIKNLGAFYMVIDLTKAQRPNAEVRAALKKLYSSLPNFKHAAVFTGSNFMLNVAAKFVLSSMGFISFSVHKTQAQAIAEIEKKRLKKELFCS